MRPALPLEAPLEPAAEDKTLLHGAIAGVYESQDAEATHSASTAATSEGATKSIWAVRSDRIRPSVGDRVQIDDCVR